MQLSRQPGALRGRSGVPLPHAAAPRRPLARSITAVVPRAQAQQQQQQPSGWWNLPPVLPLPLPSQKSNEDAPYGSLSSRDSSGSGSFSGTSGTSMGLSSSAAATTAHAAPPTLMGPGSPRTLAEVAALPSFSKAEESEILWAGYSDLSDQLRQAHAHNAALRADVAALTEAVHALRNSHEASNPSPAVGGARGALAAAAGAWQAASFLLLFLVVINIAGIIASFHLAAASFTWFGWGVGKAAATGGFFTKPMLGAITAAVPLCNSAVVIVFCIQAVKAAWLCLRF